MEKQNFIYMTTNKINGKKYIGQHRGYTNDTYLGSGLGILRAVKAYGKENFERQILEICSTEEELDERERYWIQYYNAYEDDNFYNMTKGGQDDIHGWIYVKKDREQNPEKYAELFRKNGERIQQWVAEHPEQAKENERKMLEGKKKWMEKNPERVLEIAKTSLQEGRIKWQQEHAQEHMEQVDRWRKSGTEANSQKIICKTTGEIFNSISEAARHYSIAQPNITKCLKGERKSCGKHPETGKKLIWEKFEE